MTAMYNFHVNKKIIIMKKHLLALALLLVSFFVTTIHANETSSGKNIKNKFAVKSLLHKSVAEIDAGRQCCEKAGTDSNGNQFTVEACAGWFLSNDGSAHQRACDKANIALQAVIGVNF